jgi:hypothetical protein
MIENSSLLAPFAFKLAWKTLGLAAALDLFVQSPAQGFSPASARQNSSPLDPVLLWLT